MKQKKIEEHLRQSKDLTREINDLDYDCNELAECKRVLDAELSEEAAYQERTRELIQNLKKSLYENKTDREKLIQQVSQSRKIINNLRKM